ncbi:hypothetical protein LBMAG42_15480 [Deltaproteobacteria bacterium]|nr:hypothetical protein LBMAG42_15480 [Deltaproteobacteria bacterium]
MYVERVEATGLAGMPAGPLVLERVDALRLSWAEQRALRDAMRIPFMIADAGLFHTILREWGCEDENLGGEGLNSWASWSGAAGLDSLFAADGDGLVRVRLLLRLDPPQFASLRHAALRDSRLVDALAGGPTLELAVGLRFNAAFDGLGLDLLSVAVGGAPFPTVGADRPGWLSTLLAGLSGRLCASPLDPPEWGAAASSWSAGQQRRLAEALRELATGPAALRGVLPLPREPGVLEGDRLVPHRFWAPEAQAMAGWVGAARIARPDVLVAAGAPSSKAWQKWWRAQVEAESAPLEQVILLGTEHGRDPRS